MKRTPMKRAAMPRGTQPGFGERPPRVKPLAQPLTRPVRYAAPSNEEVFAMPRSEAHRNRALLDLARGMPCLLQVDRVCNGDRDTTVAAHSNLLRHGKGGARKADDEYSVWACARCHGWLDSSYSAGYDEKVAAFEFAHVRQVAVWRKIAGDAGRPARERDAAAWALKLLAVEEGG
jgi:hypothetical protein